MKYTASLFSALALVVTLTLPAHNAFANDVKTVTSGESSAETTAEPRVIGKVSYILGQADMILPDGSVTAITKQTKILEGSKVSVKDRSKLNLLMVDGAIEKLPANSTLEFARYYYDPADPKASEIRKELTEGEVTSKTGVGGTEAKERYRLNSPLAAIAVLGTEYTVSVSAGETRVVVLDGRISMAKLEGSCQRFAFGACADGEQLAANQRGLALVVRRDQPRPVLIPASTPPATKNTTQAVSSKEEQAKEDAANKKAKEEAAAKEKEAKVAASKKAAEEAAAAKEKEAKVAADKKAAEEAAAAKEKEAKVAADKKAAEEAAAAKEKAAEVAEAKKADKQAEAPATASTSVTQSDEKSSDKGNDKTTVKETVAPLAENATDKKVVEVAKKIDERDPLAEIKAEASLVAPAVVAVQPKTPAVVVETPAPAVTVAPVVVAEAPKAASNLESTTPSSLVTPSGQAPVAVTPPSIAPSTTSSATNSMLLVSSGSSGSSGTGLLSGSTGVSLGGVLESSTGSALLESSAGSALSGGLITTPLGTPLGSTTTGLVESAVKTESTVTTDEGEVIAAVTPPPVVETPVTPAPTPALAPVRWGKYDPATMVDGMTLGDQISSQYEQIITAATAGSYSIERLKGASATLPEQRDVAFALGSYEANVRNATTGVATAATLTDATLNVSSVRNTFDTGFTLNSPVYTGAVRATGTYSAIDGILKDDGANPQTTINGGVGVLSDVTGAAYTFTHQIDTILSADGALNWTGTAIGD